MKEEDRILRKLSLMQRCVSYLRSVDSDSSELDKNDELRSAVERNFQLALESAIDIGEMIISREGLERPEIYRSVFLILGKNGIIPGGLQRVLLRQQVSGISWFTYMRT